MANSNENLKVLTPNDSQETLTSKSNFNFGKLLELIGVADVGSEYTLLPGLKGDKGDDGIRGSTVYISTSSPNYADNVDPLDTDLNYDSTSGLITIYNTSGTIPTWDELIDIHQMVVTEVATISLEAALAIFVSDTDLIVYPGINDDPYVPANEKSVLLNNFDIQNDFSTQYDKFKNAVLTLYIDNNESKWNLVIGATPESGTVTLPNMDDVLKVKLENNDSFETATAHFDLSYTDPSDAEKYTGFYFKTTNFDSITPSGSTQTHVLFGSGDYLNTISASYSALVNGIGVYSFTKVLQLGLLDATNAAIYSNTTNIAFNSNILPSASGTYDLGNGTYKFQDLYLSRNIEALDIWIGESGKVDGISYTSGKVAINYDAASAVNAFTIDGRMDFAFVQDGTSEIGTQVSTVGVGMGIQIMGGTGLDATGGNTGTDGGVISIYGGEGGDHATGGVAGVGGNVFITGGPGGSTTGTDPHLSSIILGTNKSYEKLSNVGIQTDGLPIHSFEVGDNMGWSISSITGTDTSTYDTIIYALDTIDTAYTFTLDTLENIKGRIIIVKDTIGKCGTSNVTVAVSDGAKIDLAMGSAVINTIIFDTDYAYVMMFFKQTGENKVWHIISHYGVDFT